MSFSVDLWNGIDVIKKQIMSTHRKIKALQKLITNYITIEINYSKGLENLYKECKENINSEFLLDESFQKIYEMFEFDNKNRKIYYTNLEKLIIDPLNAYLEKPKTKLNTCFSENTENYENFNRTLNNLKEKQSAFHNQCRELSSYIALVEEDEINKTQKMSRSKCQKILDRVKYAKEDYLKYIKEANRVRERYNFKTEEILNNLEEIYKTMIQKIKDSLYTFSAYRLEFLKCLVTKEQNDYDNIHSKVEPNQELLKFIMKNATKEFPMIKFEFCPIKYNVLNKYIKNKYNKFNEKDLPAIYKAIKLYFDENNIFKDDLEMKSFRKSTEFFPRFSFFTKRNAPIIIQEDSIKEQKSFIENYLTGLFMKKKNGKINKNNLDEIKNNKMEEKKKNNEDNNNKEVNENKNKNNEIMDNKNLNENNNNEKKEENNEVEAKNSINTTKDNNINKNNENNIINEKENEKSENNKKETIKDKNENNNNIKEENNIGNNNVIEEDINTNLFEDNTNIEEEIQNKESKKEKNDLDELINLINNTNENSFLYIEVIIKKLSYLRSKGMFQITEDTYSSLITLFDIILNQNPKNDYILKNVLILCQTFYKLEDNEKIYLQQGIRGRPLFNSSETWHRVINYSMNLSSSDKDLTNLKPNEIIDKINKESEIVVIAYLCDIKQYTDDENVFNDVKKYYIEIYNMDENKVNKEVEDYMKVLSKKYNKKEDKKEKEEKEKENKPKSGELTLNDISTNNNININNILKTYFFDYQNKTKVEKNNNMEIINVNNFIINRYNSANITLPQRFKDNLEGIKESEETQNKIIQKNDDNIKDNINNNENNKDDINDGKKDEEKKKNIKEEDNVKEIDKTQEESHTNKENKLDNLDIIDNNIGENKELSQPGKVDENINKEEIVEIVEINEKEIINVHNNNSNKDKNDNNLNNNIEKNTNGDNINKNINEDIDIDKKNKDININNNQNNNNNFVNTIVNFIIKEEEKTDKKENEEKDSANKEIKIEVINENVLKEKEKEEKKEKEKEEIVEEEKERIIEDNKEIEIDIIEEKSDKKEDEKVNLEKEKNEQKEKEKDNTKDINDKTKEENGVKEVELLEENNKAE